MSESVINNFGCNDLRWYLENKQIHYTSKLVEMVIMK